MIDNASTSERGVTRACFVADLSWAVLSLCIVSRCFDGNVTALLLHYIGFHCERARLAHVRPMSGSRVGIAARRELGIVRRRIVGLGREWPQRKQVRCSREQLA